MFHEYTSGKGSCGFVVEHVFIEFVRGAMGHLVSDEGIVVDMLLLVGNHTSIALAFGSLARESQVESVASDAVVEGDDIMVHTTMTLLVDIDIAHTNILGVSLFQTIQIQ